MSIVDAAKAVIDEYSKHGLMMTGYDSGQIALANLRKAVAEADGMVLVPSEPTAEMVKVGCCDFGVHMLVSRTEMTSAYKAMLAAAQVKP